jgi:hypothetical protein
MPGFGDEGDKHTAKSGRSHVPQGLAGLGRTRLMAGSQKAEILEMRQAARLREVADALIEYTAHPFFPIDGVQL